MKIIFIRYKINAPNSEIGIYWQQLNCTQNWINLFTLKINIVIETYSKSKKLNEIGWNLFLIFKAETPKLLVSRVHTTNLYCELNATKYNIILNTSHSSFNDSSRSQQANPHQRTNTHVYTMRNENDCKRYEVAMNTNSTVQQQNMRISFNTNQSYSIQRTVFTQIRIWMNFMIHSATKNSFKTCFELLSNDTQWMARVFQLFFTQI